MQVKVSQLENNSSVICHNPEMAKLSCTCIFYELTVKRKNKHRAFVYMQDMCMFLRLKLYIKFWLRANLNS